MKKQKGKLHNAKNLLKACSTHRNTKTGSFATAPTRQASPCLEFSITVLLCKAEARKKAAHRRQWPPARVAASQTLGLSTNFGSVRATTRSRWDAALPTSRRAPGGVPLTRLPRSLAPPREDARGDADTREAMGHVGDPAATDRRVPGVPLEGRGWPARGGTRVSRHTILSSVRPSVPAPALRAEAAQRGALPSGSAGRRPRATIRTIVSAAAAAQTAPRSAPPRPGRLRHPEPPTGRAVGPPHSSGAPRARAGARTAAALDHPRLHLTPTRTPGHAARISRPSSWHTWTRPARLPPALANSSTRGCRSRPTGSAGLGLKGGGEKGTHTRGGMDCFRSRKLNHVLSLNSSVTLVDFG